MTRSIDVAYITSLLEKRFEGGEIKVKQWNVEGDGGHFAVDVKSSEFAGKSELERTNMIHDAIGRENIGGEIHALHIKASTDNADEDDNFTEEVSSSDEGSGLEEAKFEAGSVGEVIYNKIKSHDIVLFMKGTKDFPMCGFSGRLVEVLTRLVGDDFHDVNVLEDEDIRQGIKDFSNWPTIPQLYIKGKFIGGSDIVLKMYQAGNLQKMFNAVLGLSV